MKYRFEKMERAVTPQEKRLRSLAVTLVLAAIVVIMLILFGMRWYRVHVFKSRVAELKQLVESGELLKACDFVRECDRDAAVTAARWAEVSAYKDVVTEMQLVRAKHAPKWDKWQTDIKFTLNVEAGYDKYFIRTEWIQEDGLWVLDLRNTCEYMPIDDTTRGRTLDMLESVTGLDLEDFLQNEQTEQTE